MKIIVLLIQLITVVILPGCWDMREMEELGFATILGVDRSSDKDELILTVGVNGVRVTGGSSSSVSDSAQQSIVYQASANTLAAALGRIQQVSFKKLFLSNVSVIVIGEEAARKNMLEILSFLDRDRELRRSSSVVITTGRAVDILSTVSPRGVSASDKLISLLDTTEQTGIAIDTRLGDYIFEPLATGGIEPIAARVITTSPPAKLTKERQAEGSGITEKFPGDQGTQGTVSQNTGELRVSGMAVFRGLEMVGWLGEKESMGWGWIKGRIHQGYLVNLTPRGGKLPVTFHLMGGKSSFKFNLKDGKVTAMVTIKVRAELSQWEATRGLINPDSIKSLEAALAEEIKSDTIASLKKAQRELKSDIFGFGFQLNRKHHQEWNRNYKDKWTEIFPTIPINVQVKASLQETGTVVKELKINP